MKFCPFCHKEISTNNNSINYCSNCGSRINSVNYKPINRKQFNENNNLAIIFAVIYIIVYVIGTYFSLRLSSMGEAWGASDTIASPIKNFLSCSAASFLFLAIIPCIISTVFARKAQRNFLYNFNLFLIIINVIISFFV